MATDDFFYSRIDQMIRLQYPLAVLAGLPFWTQIEAALAPAFARKNRQGRRHLTATCLAPRWSLPGQVSVQQAGTANAF